MGKPRFSAKTIVGMTEKSYYVVGIEYFANRLYITPKPQNPNLAVKYDYLN